MTRQIIVRPAVEADIQAALDWYEGRETGLGGRFLDELDSALSRIDLMPLQFPDIGQGLRRALFRRFPHAVYFVLADSGAAVIIAVLHQRRDPASWWTRFQKETGVR